MTSSAITERIPDVSAKASSSDGIIMVATLLAAIVVAVVFPMFAQLYTVINATIFISLCILSLSLGLVWGYGGIFCLGQAVFFGLGGYAYAIASLNAGETTIGVAAAILVPMFFAALVGNFIFWGRIGDVYVGVITLTITLIFSQLLNGSAGDAYTIGSVPLGGFNGIPMTPQLNMPGDPSNTLSTEVIFGVAIIALALAYVLCRAYLASATGKTMVAIRENETRVELLGYDTRVVKLITFVIGAGLAGLAGMLFANSLTVTPNMFSLSITAQIVIWVLIGGRGTLLGPLVGCVLIQVLTTALGTSGFINPEVILGGVLIIFVMFVPSGLAPALRSLLLRLTGNREG